MTPADILSEVQALGIELSANGNKLHVEAPSGVLTLELKRALKEHKTTITMLLTLPPPAQPGAELEQLRREIGQMARAEAAQWEYSDELDPDWPPSAKVYKRLRRKEPTRWQASTLQESEVSL